MKFKVVVLALCLFFVGSTAFSSTSYFIPQVAVGSSYTTTFVFFNNGSASTNVTLTITKNDASPLSVTIPGMGTNSTFTFTLPVGGSKFLVASSTSDNVGAATVTSENPIGVTANYTIYKSGNFWSEVAAQAVPDSVVANSSFILPYQYYTTPNVQTVLALFNTSTSSQTVSFSVRTTDGTSAGSFSIR